MRGCARTWLQVVPAQAVELHILVPCVHICSPFPSRLLSLYATVLCIHCLVHVSPLLSWLANLRPHLQEKLVLLCYL